MAGIDYTSRSVSIAHRNFSGGLNSTGGPLSLNDTESSDLQNINFDKFGSIFKRNGYTALNTSAITNTPNSDGLWWYEAVVSNASQRNLVNVADGKLFKQDDLDGTWDDITGGLTITADNNCDFDNFLNEVYITNGTDVPFKWTGTGNGETFTVPVGLTKSKHIKQFENFLFLANVVVSGTVHQSRFYWSGIKNTESWDLADFIEVSKDDGQEITGVKVLGDRFVVFKNRAIYNVFFTGDATIPFILRKSNSSVGCIAPFSIQKVDNGLVFLSFDGLYFYDGNNSYKISEKVGTTLSGMNTTRFNDAKSLNFKDSNQYWLALTSSGNSTNDRILVWDYFHNAFSVYVGMAPSAMTTVYVDGKDERPYFADYAGFVYRADISTDDNPLNVTTAIDAFYWTNWKTWDDIVNKKATPQTTVFYKFDNTILSFSWSYDFEEGEQFTQTFSLATATDVYGTGVYGTAIYGGSGGAVRRRDLKSRGRVVRFKFSNNILGEQFRIDGFGVLPYLETNV